jgi:hypothetical protein
MQHQLYMYGGLRSHIIERHDFYAEQDHELLTISEDQFGQLADNVRLFWEAFPEKSFYGGEET